MENESGQSRQDMFSGENTGALTPLMRPRKFISTKTAIIIAALLIVLALLYYYRGIFIAAIVNGSPISRLAIVRESEKQSGGAVLDSLITRKLIESEAAKKGLQPSAEEIAARIKQIEDQVTASGQTLESAIKAEGFTMDDLKDQITAQLKLEKLLEEKINVTDEEVAKYIKDNKIKVPKGKEAERRDQIRGGLRQQKLQTEAQAFVQNLRTEASIHYFVGYAEQ